MADIKKLIPFILRWEGGFVDDPLDCGGATNKGITIATFRQFFGAGATVDQLKNITDDQWMQVFRKGYWGRWRGDEIRNQSIANILVDWVWASGKHGIEIPQKILGVTGDGVVGPKTIAALNGHPDQRALFCQIKQARINFVDGIVSRNPSQKRFINGWKNRINAFIFEV